MLYFKLEDGVVTEVANKWDMLMEMEENQWVSRWEFECFEQAMLIAIQAETTTGNAYLPIDNGESVSPRYDVIEAPKVGDKVSYAFNGDFYPDGKIVKISASGKVITTSSGKKYYRGGLTASWKNSKIWSLVQGHHDERNPHF